MEPTGVGGAFGYGAWWLSELAFRWIPGTVINIAEGGPLPYISVESEGTFGAKFGPLTHAITPVEAVQYLQGAAAPGVYDVLYHRWSVFVALSLFVSLLFSALVIYCAIRIFQVRQLERRRYAAMQHTIEAQDQPQTQLRWHRIMDQLQSDDQRSWRFAILEADIMLSELLDMQGYRGETMADKMKQVERGDFRTIDMAWEAHRMRNRIAHEGEGLSLTNREAKRIITLYERVFHEFKLI